MTGAATWPLKERKILTFPQHYLGAGKKLLCKRATGLKKKTRETSEYTAYLASGFIPNLNSGSSGSKGDASWSPCSQEGGKAAPGCLLEAPRRQLTAGIAPQIPKRVDLGLAWTRVPAASVKTLLAAASGAQDTGARHPITLGAQGEIGDKEAGSCTPGNPAGSAAPPSRVRGAESKSRNKW